MTELGIVNLTQAGRNAIALHPPLCAHHVLPNQDRPCVQEPTVRRLHEMTTEAKQILRKSM
jgi:hypothetical protein